MDRTETIKIMAVLRAAYPMYYAKQSTEDLQGVVNLWTEMFSDEPYQLVAMAVKALIKTRVSTFPPAIGEITEKIMQLTKPDEMTELEAWALVSKALKNSGYSSREEFEKLPPIIQRIIGSHYQLREWSQLDQDEVDTVVASNFQRSYRARAKSEREFEALPADVKDFMVQLAAGMDIKQLEI